MLRLILPSVVSCLVVGVSSQITVSSTGPAATKQGSKLGQYALTNRTQNGFSVFEQTDGARNFLYVSSLGFWTVGRTEGSTVSGLYSTQLPTPPSPPTSGWLYSD